MKLNQSQLFKVTVALLIFILTSLNIDAQVTIGSKEEPVSGALLQLKDINQNESTGITNATRGLGMPRVLLTKKHQLLPMFADNLDEYTANKEVYDAEHVGLMVYNTVANTNEIICKGLNVWDGKEWMCLKRSVNYTIDCNSISVKGVYWANQAVNESHYVTLDILPDENDLGNIYKIKTNTVEGVSFEGEGVISSIGRQTVKLQARGTPENTKIKTMSLSTNSLIPTSCSFKLYIVIPQKTILSLGTGQRALHQDNGGGTGEIFNNVNNFGTLEASYFKVETPIVYGFDKSSVYVKDLQPYIAPTDGSKPVDIVFITYNADLVASDNNAAGKLLAEYVRKGGVVIYNNEHMFSHNSGAPGKFIQDLFGGDTNIWGEENVSDGGWLFKLPDYDDIILNGPFGDIRGAYVGEDGCCGDAFNYIPASEIEWSFSSFDYSGSSGGSHNQISGFKAKNYNLFWCGDGGIGSGNGGTSTSSYPVSLDSNYRPTDKWYGRNSSGRQYVKNARLVANLFCWAFQQAEHNGINSK